MLTNQRVTQQDQQHYHLLTLFSFSPQILWTCVLGRIDAGEEKEGRVVILLTDDLCEGANDDQDGTEISSNDCDDDDCDNEISQEIRRTNKEIGENPGRKMKSISKKRFCKPTLIFKMYLE